MHSDRGGAWAPRPIRGAGARRKINRELRAAIVAATQGLPGVKTDALYEARSGKRQPWDKGIASAEAQQDAGAPDEAIVLQLELIRAHLANRRQYLLGDEDLAA